jgi:hypothetical protein
MGEKENKAEKEDAVQKIRQIANQCLQERRDLLIDDVSAEEISLSLRKRGRRQQGNDELTLAEVGRGRNWVPDGLLIRGM